MWHRIALYLKEMYPPVPAFLMACISFFNLFFMLALLHHQPLQVTWPAIGGALTIFLFLLFLRVSDELKDLESDKILFPERLVPSGRVKESDLNWLMGFTVAAMVLLNFFVTQSLFAFGVLFAYGVLMFHYFFFPKQISGNLMLALITHNPSVILMNIYTVAVFCQFYQQDFWNPLHFYFITLFWLPGLAWELARKIRCEADETDYTTYSKIFGYKLSALLPAAVIGLQFMLMVRLFDLLQFSGVFLLLLSALVVVVAGFFFRFILNPTTHTSKLKPVMEAYMLMSSVWLFTELLRHQSVLWSL